MRRTIPLLMLLAILAVGCRLETNLGVQINADGSGVISAEVGLDDEAQSLIQQFAGDEDPFADNPLADFPNATRTEEDRGGMHYVIYSATVDDIAAAVNEMMTASQDDLVQQFDLTITPTRIEVSGQGSVAAAMQGADSLMTPEQLAQAVTANLRITLPGKILESDATSREGNTLIWALPITGGEITIHAVSDPSQSEGGGFPLWAIIVIAVVVVVGIAAILVLGRKRGGKALAPPPPPPPAPEMPSA
jgi:hypothetical protein